MTPTRIAVTGDQPYDVVVGEGLLDDLHLPGAPEGHPRRTIVGHAVHFCSVAALAQSARATHS